MQAYQLVWTKPEIADGCAFEVEQGRHPVVEAHMGAGEFVPNDLAIGDDGLPSFALITGPNMAGKSTFLRQNALIALLAQTGSFVPAKKAKLGIVDSMQSFICDSVMLSDFIYCIISSCAHCLSIS